MATCNDTPRIFRSIAAPQPVPAPPASPPRKPHDRAASRTSIPRLSSLKSTTSCGYLRNYTQDFVSDAL